MLARMTTPIAEKTALLRYAGDDGFVAQPSSGHAIVTSVGEGTGAASPMELVLVALAGCTGADVVSILRKKRQKVTGYEIEVRGVRRDEHPRIYTTIEVVHRVRGRGVDPRAVAQAVELSEHKYCSVSAMLAASTTINSSYVVLEDD